MLMLVATAVLENRREIVRPEAVNLKCPQLLLLYLVPTIYELISQCPISPNSPIFVCLFRGSFTKLYFISKVYKYILRASIPTTSFLDYSLQKGAAISVNAKGLSKDEIKSLNK